MNGVRPLLLRPGENRFLDFPQQKLITYGVPGIPGAIHRRRSVESRRRGSALVPRPRVGWELPALGRFLPDVVSCEHRKESHSTTPDGVPPYSESRSPPWCSESASATRRYSGRQPTQMASESSSPAKNFAVRTAVTRKPLMNWCPRYLSSIPRAKYCLTGEFSYSNSYDSPALIWNKAGPCHKVYSFRTKQWGLAD